MIYLKISLNETKIKLNPIHKRVFPILADQTTSKLFLELGEIMRKQCLCVCRSIRSYVNTLEMSAYVCRSEKSFCSPHRQRPAHLAESGDVWIYRIIVDELVEPR